MIARAVCILLAVVAASGCGDNLTAPAATDAGAPDAAAPDAAVDPLNPARLSETGLYADFEARTLADGVREYVPSYELWSDGAAKRRYILLPEGTTLDTSDMDFWSYPVGTKLWKEFRVDGSLVETRLIWKRGEGDWFRVAYAWDEAETEAVAAPAGVKDALGTHHDIPEEDDCQKCHIRQPDFVLGFSAIQLAHDQPGVNLGTLADEGRLSDPPAAPIVVPGDEVERAALGYLHANCGGCHHPLSDVTDKTNINLQLAVGSMATVQDTPAYQTSVGVAPELQLPGVTAILAPGDKEASSIWVRMSIRGDEKQMPQAGTEIVDPAGLAAIEAWIDLLGQQLGTP